MEFKSIAGRDGTEKFVTSKFSCVKGLICWG